MKTYNNLLDAGWHMREIDDMDMLGFWEVRAWKANSEHKTTSASDGKVYLDDVW